MFLFEGGGGSKEGVLECNEREREGLLSSGSNPFLDRSKGSFGLQDFPEDRQSVLD